MITNQNEVEQLLELAAIGKHPNLLVMATSEWTDAQYRSMIDLLNANGYRAIKDKGYEKQEVIGIASRKTYNTGKRAPLELAAMLAGLQLVGLHGGQVFKALGGKEDDAVAQGKEIHSTMDEAIKQGTDIIDCALSGEIGLAGELDGQDVEVRLCEACMHRAIAGSEKELDMFRNDRTLRMLLMAVVVMSHSEGERVEARG